MPGGNDTPHVPPSPAIICAGALREREPAKFNGNEEQDVEDWLASFERVSTHNRWDDAMKLNNVSFSFTGLAEVWFNNHGSGITAWPAFKTELIAAFGRPAVRKLLAEQRLHGRVQKTGETFTSYIEDVLDLCKRLNPSMTDPEKIKHVMKGIDEGAFQMLLARGPGSIAELVNLCQSYDELRRQRVSTRRTSVQDEAIASLVRDPDNSSLLLQIKQIVREEVARQLSLLPYTPEPSSTLAPTLRSVIQEQVADAISPTPTAPPRHNLSVTTPLPYAESVARTPVPIVTYADAVGVPPQRVPMSYQHPVPMRPPPLSRPPPQSSSAWRTWDNRPICFNCRCAGHVARYCRRRLTPTNDDIGAPTYGPRSQSPREVSYRSDFTAAPSDSRTFATRRSSSPRRRSLSPMRRRPTVTEEEN